MKNIVDIMYLTRPKTVSFKAKDIEITGQRNICWRRVEDLNSVYDIL